MSGADLGTFGIDREMVERLTSLSRRTGRTGAELVREALTAFLSVREDYRLPSWVAASARRPDPVER